MNECNIMELELPSEPGLLNSTHLYVKGIFGCNMGVGRINCKSELSLEFQVYFSYRAKILTNLSVERFLYLIKEN
jgi:hypothetical protein